MKDTPKIFRIPIDVSNLEEATAFYSELLGNKGQQITDGNRHYFTCGSVILALIDTSAGKKKPKPMPNYIYFTVYNLEKVFKRAKALRCLLRHTIHGQPGGDIITRPWGERSFYAEDPDGNGLCFVDEKTVFTGK